MTQIFQKALIPVKRPDLFNLLQSAIERVFAAECVEQFLKRLAKTGVSIRNFQDVLDKRILENVDSSLKQSGHTARALYDALPVSDQAQMRELYLTALESVEQGVREKYAKIYRYY
jgi:hypothetical protein